MHRVKLHANRAYYASLPIIRLGRMLHNKTLCARRDLHVDADIGMLSVVAGYVSIWIDFFY